MDDMPDFRDFGSSEKLLAYLKERSDDLEKVVICPPGAALSYAGRPVYIFPEFSMMFYFVNEGRLLIKQTDTEIVLNDGILNRMKIKIELMRKPG